MLPDQSKAPIIDEPTFDKDGFLEWSEALERVFQQEQNLRGEAAVVVRLPQGGYASALLFGRVFQGAPRKWVVRTAALMLEEYAAKYSITYQYTGEADPGAMYPRLPMEERVTGVTANIGRLEDAMSFHFGVIDRTAEAAHQEAIAATRSSMKKRIAELQAPRPWWRFW